MRRRFLWQGPEGACEILIEALPGGLLRVEVGGETSKLDCSSLGGGRRSVLLPSGRQLSGRAWRKTGERVEARIGGRDSEIPMADPLRQPAASGGAESEGETAEIRAQIPGRVLEVLASLGELVEAGSTLVVLEAMKMQNEIRAEAPGRVVELGCRAGEAVEAGALLVRLEPLH